MTPTAHQVQKTHYSPDQRHQISVHYKSTMTLLFIKTQQEWAAHFLDIVELHRELEMDQDHSYNVVCILTAIILEMLLLQNQLKDSSTHVSCVDEYIYLDYCLSDLIGSVNPEMTPPAHQGQQSYSWPHQIHQRPVYYSSVASYRSPARMGGTFPMCPGTTPGAWNRPEMIPPAHEGQQRYYSPHQRHQRPVYNSGMGRPFPMHQGTTPGGWNRPESIPNYGFPSNAGASTDSGVYGPGVYHGQSRGHWLGTSPNPASAQGGSPSSGRGRGHWHGSSMVTGSGRSGRRGRGFHPRGLQPGGTLGPERFYDKSMVEDPWQHMEPVIWKSLDTPGSSNSWLPKSISMKKERVPEASNKTSSQPSLAEYLAASFNEAVNDAADV